MSIIMEKVSSDHLTLVLSLVNNAN